MAEPLKGLRNDMPRVVLRSTLGYLERESARRAKGQHAGMKMMRLQDNELAALVDVLRREVGTDPLNDKSTRGS